MQELKNRIGPEAIGRASQLIALMDFNYLRHLFHQSVVLGLTIPCLLEDSVHCRVNFSQLVCLQYNACSFSSETFFCQFLFGTICKQRETQYQHMLAGHLRLQYHPFRADTGMSSQHDDAHRSLDEKHGQKENSFGLDGA